MNILVVFPDQERAQAQLVELNVRRALGNSGSTVVELVRNEEDAYNLFHSKDYNLVIVAINIPKTSTTPLNPEERAGLSFLRQIRSERYRIPSILVTDDINNETFYKIQELELCVPVLRGNEDWELTLTSRVRQQLGLSDVKQRKKTRWVDIRWDLENRRGDYRIKGGLLGEARGVLESVDVKTLRQLLVDSRAVGRDDTPGWIESFHNIGERLWEELFRKNYNLVRDFTRAVPTLGSDDECVRIRFLVTTSVHPLAFEALIDDDSTYRMLRSPVYRKIEGAGEPLFAAQNASFIVGEENAGKDIAVKRCLVIVAETVGSVYELTTRHSEHILRRLKYLDDEGRRVEEYLTSKGVCVSRIGGSSESSASISNLRQVLRSGPWDAVHFAGHSFWDEGDSGRAVIFLPGESKSQPQPLDIEPLAVLLRKAATRFVYLSSCSSSGCAVELARKQIPSIVGYRWEIDDELAAKHAECLYKNMFECPESLEIAFLRTRQEMWQDYPNNRIWASSVLIRQTERD